MMVFIRLGLVLAIFASACALPRVASGADQPRAIDVRASHAIFSVQHLLVQRVSGQLPIVAGTVDLASDGFTPTAVKATLDARRIDTGDGDRDGDLQGTDWFDTRRYPLWTFVSSHIETTAPGAFLIGGMLTIHGMSTPVTLATTLVRDAGSSTYHALAHVDRHLFGMVVTRADGMIGSDVTIVLDIRLQ